MALKLDGREDEIQELLDAGYSYHKIEKLIGVTDKTIKSLVIRKGLEIYVAFDEIPDVVQDSATSNLDWLYAEDVLDQVCYEAYYNNYASLPLTNKDIGRYVTKNYGDIFAYLDKMNALVLENDIYMECKACNKHRPINMFYRRGSGLYGLEVVCRNCESKRLTRASKIYYIRNIDKMKESAKKWQLDNVEKVREYAKLALKKRRARKAQLPHDLTSDQQILLMNTFNESCALTGDVKIHLDHVIPISIGHGGTTFGNMIPLRSDLNLSKNDRNIFEWFEENKERFELSQERFNTLIEWLADANNMTTEEYRKYVYWCFANPRTIDEGEVI